MRLWRRVLQVTLPLACTTVFPLASLADLPANTESVPKQILKTGVDLDSSDLSPNSRQLADILKLTPLLQRIQTVRGKIDPVDFEANMENIASSQHLIAATAEATQIIQETNLAIDFTLAEITAEQNLYNSMLSTFASDRDKTVLKTNAASFVVNGVLWTVCEGFDLPTYKYARLSIPSAITGILAGVVPSVASMYALKQLDGKKRFSETEPNMLAKLFDYPTSPEIEYPRPIWLFLNSAPPDEKKGISRKELLINRWVSDKNIPSFTDRGNKKTLDVITASKAHQKGLSISTLTTRLSMLQQLGAEILKMKRMLLELSMAIHGEKNV